MDLSRFLRRVLPVAGPLLLFLAVSMLYFLPQFRGEVLPQHDLMQFDGMAKEIRQMRAETGEDPQWSGAMFGGMPAYLIDIAYPAQLVKRSVSAVTRIVGTPASYLFFAMTAMWLMLLIWGVDPRAAAVGAVAYGLSTYFLLIIGAGHSTKMWALVYAPLMMGGAWMVLRGSLWYGAALTAFATSLEIGANHPQITYYFLLAMAAFWISEGIAALREKRLPAFWRRTAVLAGAGVLAVLSNFAPLWYTAQHTKDTIRGGSELTVTAGQSEQGGLDFKYATDWSYGPAESFNLLIPDFMGRESGATFSARGATATVLNDYGLRGAAQQLSTYWGDQPYTGGPTYLGAAALFLAVLGLFLLSGRNKWWLAAICAVMLLLAWGRHFEGFTRLFFNYLPGYDKFRTVSMTLVIWQWAVPLLGALALMRLWRDEIPRTRLWRALGWAVGLTGGLCLLFAVAGGSLFDFGQERDAAMMTEQFTRIFNSNHLQEYLDRGLDVEWGETAAAAMAADRIAMMEADAWRSLLMILLAAGSILLFVTARIGKGLLAVLLTGIMLLDLLPVDRRFLSSDDFVSPRRRQIAATEADRQILEDRALGYRVLNLTVSPFNDATTSYFHRSVGGYHGAKLARYQDLIDRYLSRMDEGVLDMLNTRYLIVADEAGNPQPLRRDTEFGAAWFVDRTELAGSAQEEIDLLGAVNLQTTAVVDERGASFVEGITDPAPLDSLPAGARRITLDEYRPNYLRYSYAAPESTVAVFSEIFYDKGWRAYVDGVENPYFRADYVLRAMRLPAGEHTVEWRFRAPGWQRAEWITGIASLLILAGALWALVHRLRHLRRRPSEAL